jgi:hypothetical protein
MWLRDFLAMDLQEKGIKTRILTFGYNADLNDNECIFSIADFSRILLDLVDSVRCGSEKVILITYKNFFVEEIVDIKCRSPALQ